MSDEQSDLAANPAYAVSQLAKALLNKGEKSSLKVRQWVDVLTGMLQGALVIGTRSPVFGVPPWATLEVVHGGFATGGLAAGGALRPHELAKLRDLLERGLLPGAQFDQITAETGRALLNLYYAGEDGRKDLIDIMHSGCFRIDYAEEAALLFYVWLFENSEEERALQLLEAITPYFQRLPFYPVPATQPLRTVAGNIVYLQTAGECERRLRNRRNNLSVLAMNEAIQIWTPLYDRAVSLFLETVEGAIPTFQRHDSSGLLIRSENGQPVACGGWPCKRYSDDWHQRAKDLLDDYNAARKEHTVCGKPEKVKENFARLRNYLKVACENPANLTGRDVGSIRKILAAYVTAHGAPDSARLAETRAKQQAIAARPLYKAFSDVLADRLAQEPADEGVADTDRLVSALSEQEAVKVGTVPGTLLPWSIQRKLDTCKEAPLKLLVQTEVISSGEVLAVVVPQLTSRMQAARIADSDLSLVYEACYRAFRRRRSLLLLNLQSQIRMNELPWISALEPLLRTEDASRTAARLALVEGVSVLLSTFPYAIVPNKLVKELRPLAKAGGVEVSLVDELAADIFMGAFSANFLEAAHAAGRLLQGTLYERYYGIDYEQILALNDLQAQGTTHVSPGLARLCVERAKYLTGNVTNVYSPAVNGTIIEQCQIVTSHNLASLWLALDLNDVLAPDLHRMVEECFHWICQRLQFNFPIRHTELTSIKNCAYAWRQILFFISMAGETEQKWFLLYAEAHFERQSVDFKERFLPVLVGLREVIGGAQFDSQGCTDSGGRRFTGWSPGGHFLMKAKRE